MTASEREVGVRHAPPDRNGENDSDDSFDYDRDYEKTYTEPEADAQTQAQEPYDRADMYRTRSRTSTDTSSRTEHDQSKADHDALRGADNHHHLRTYLTRPTSRSHSISRTHSHSHSASEHDLTTTRSLHAVDDDALAEQRAERRLSRAESRVSGRVGAHGVDVEKGKGEGGGDDGVDEFLVLFDGDTDPESPRSLPGWRKWACVLTLAMGAVAVTCQSSIYTTTYEQIMPKFHSSREVATLGLSSFIFGMGIGPLFLAPLSEFYGRRWVYIISFAIFTIFLVPCAVARNMATLIVCRMFGGVAGSAFLSVAGGSVGDLFGREAIGFPMMVYTASPFVGPELGPLLGGFINEYTLWRWTFYVMLIWSGVVLLCIILLVPETYHPVLLRRKAQRLRATTGDPRHHALLEHRTRSVGTTVLRSCYRPMQILLLEPMCLNLCIFSAILLGIIYLFFGAFDQTFQGTHGFSISRVGLSFLGLLVGMMLGVGTDPLWRRNFARLVREKEERMSAEGKGEGHGVEFEPEWRLPPAIVGAPAVTVGLFIFAWTMYPNVHWIAPIIGSGVFGFGVILVYSGIFTFLVDAYPVYAASALAANSFLRSMFATVFPLFGHQMYENLGYNWASCLLAFLTLAMLPFPYIFYRYGAKIRSHSRFAAKA